MSNPQTLPASGNATSSPASPDGRSPQGSPAGRTPANSGPAPRRASRSASRARSEAPTTSGTFGPTYFASSVPDGPLSSWENRLRQRLARIGSTECMLTWKASATPAGRSLSRLVPSMRPTDGTDFGLWQTPVADDAVNRVRGKWNSRGEPKLSGQVMVLWVTPSARDWKDSPGIATTREDGRSRIDQLPRPVAAAMWATPTSLAPAKDGNNEAGNSAGLVSIRAHAVAAHGPVPDGSSATMEKPGALNPEFVCWLMGFPPEWDACAPSATPLSRSSRRK